MATRTISNAGGNWNATGTWVEGAVPTNADDVVATATSGPLTVNVASVARSMDLTGYTNTLTMTSTLSLGTTTAQASLIMCKLSTTTTIAGGGGGSFLFGGTYTTNALTIDLAGRTLTGGSSFNTAGRWQLVAGFSAQTLSHTSGNLDLNGQTLNIASAFSSTGSTVRTLTMGAATVNCTSGTNAFTLSGTNLTFSGASSTVNFVGSVAQAINVSHTGITLGTINFNSTTGGLAPAVVGTFTCVNLTRIGTTSHNERLWIAPSSTVTVTGTLTITDNSGTGIWCGPGARADVAPTAGATCTIALGATGTASLSGVTFTDTTFTGTNTPVNGTRIGDGLGNSGITFDASRTLYWVGNAGNTSDSAHWSLTSGGSGGQVCPLPQDDIVVDANSITANSNSVATNYDRLGRNLNWTNNRVGSAMANAFSVFGDYNYDGASSSSGITLRGRGSHTLYRGPFAGTLSGAITLVAPGGTYTMTSNITTNLGSLTLTTGTFALASYTCTLSTGSFVANSGTLPRTLDLGTGTLICQTGSADILFGTAASNFTLTGTATSTIQHGPTNTSRPITSNGQTIPGNLIIAPTGSGSSYPSDPMNVAGTITLVSNTFAPQAGATTVTCNGFISTGSLARTIVIQPGNTFTVNGDFIVTGTNAGMHASATGYTINVNATSLQGRFASAGLTFLAGSTVNLKPMSNANARLTVESPGTFAGTLTIDGSAATHGMVVFSDNVTVTGTLTVTGNGVGNEVYLYGPDWGGSATITAATTTLSHVVTNRIVGAGAGSWTGTNVTMTDDGWKQAVGA